MGSKFDLSRSNPGQIRYEIEDGEFIRGTSTADSVILTQNGDSLSFGNHKATYVRGIDPDDCDYPWPDRYPDSMNIHDDNAKDL